MTTTMTTTTIKDNNGHAPFVRRMTWLKRIVYLCISTIAILWCWQSVVMTTISSSRKNKNKDNTKYYSYSYDNNNHKNHANYDHNSLLLHQQQQPKTNPMNHHDNHNNVMMMEQQHHDNHPYYHRPAHRITQYHNNDPQQQQQPKRRRRRRKTKWHLRKRPQPQEQEQHEYDDTNRLELRQQEQEQQEQDHHVGSSRPPFLHKLKKDHYHNNNNNNEEQDEEEWEKSRTDENSDDEEEDDEDEDEDDDEEEEEEDETDKAMFQAQLLKSILQADWQLIDLKMNRVAIEEYKQKNREEENPPFQKNRIEELDYTGYFTAMFCPLNWTAYETNPSQMHMFHHLVSASNCEEITGTTHGFDLYRIVQAAKHYDAIQQQQKKQKKEPRQMPPLQQQYHEQQYQEQYQEQQQYRRTQYDKEYNNNHNVVYSTFSRPKNKLVQTLDFAGAVFHESRCGSTLTSNLMQWHNPMENVVYSESGPPSIVLMAFLEHRPKLNAMELIRQSQQRQEQQSQRQEESQQQQEQQQESSQVMDPLPMAIQILQDVFYLMSRTNRMEKRRVLFKMTPSGGLNLPLFQAAFPHVPWIFLYRDPVEVLMSHLKVGWRANCAKSKYGPNGGKTIRYREVHYMMHDTLLPLWYNNDNNENTTTATTATAINVDETLLEPINLSLYDYCATFLATMSETFAQDVSGWLSSSTTSTTRTTIQSVHDLGGIPVNYKDVPDLLIDTIWPKVWNLTIDDESRQRMEYGSHAYSKSAGRSNAASTTDTGTTTTDKSATTTTKSSSTTTTKSATTTTFTDDSKFKQDTAPQGLKKAATTILQPSYQKLNRLAEQAKELLKTLPP